LHCFIVWQNKIIEKIPKLYETVNFVVKIFLMATFILVIILLGLGMLMFAITILLKKNGKFPDTHIEDNPHLKKYGITCASHDEYECNLKKNEKNDVCASCVVTTCSLQH
jgi:hypothetical protein